MAVEFEIISRGNRYHWRKVVTVFRVPIWWYTSMYVYSTVREAREAAQNFQRQLTRKKDVIVETFSVE